MSMHAEISTLALLRRILMLLVALLILYLYGTAWSCDNIPEEPDAQDAASEGPKGISGLYELDYDLGGGRRLLTLRRIMDMTLDAGLEATYMLESYPLLYVVIVPGRADAMYVDQGHGLLGIPQGLCFEILRYQ